jgi:nucleoid-associated protein YgaU
LVWGSWIFNGRLQSLAVQYTLFKPNGDPLRAKLTLTFTSSITEKEAELRADTQSPDLSHRVLVRDGDTLPLLCERIYGDPGYYIEVARFNGLVDFRRLEPGTRLHFPPLE